MGTVLHTRPNLRAKATHSVSKGWGKSQTKEKAKKKAKKKDDRKDKTQQKKTERGGGRARIAALLYYPLQDEPTPPPFLSAPLAGKGKK